MSTLRDGRVGRSSTHQCGTGHNPAPAKEIGPTLGPFEYVELTYDTVRAKGGETLAFIPVERNQTARHHVSLHMISPRLHATKPAGLLLCAATLLVLGGCSSQGANRASDTAAAPRTPTSTPDPTQDPVTAPPQLIPYAGGESIGAEVRTTADANNLAGAPDSFKKFIGRTAERLTRGATCEGGYVGVTVKTLRTDGYAVGAVNECGGYVALWAIVNGDWKEIDATQDLWDCAVLAEHRVPGEIAGDTCYDHDAQAQIAYQQA